MDIYSFLNSKDIAEYCRRLQKTWTPLQMGRTASNIIAEYTKGWHGCFIADDLLAENQLAEKE